VAASGGGGGVGVADTGVSVGKDGVGGADVPKRELQAERPRTNINVRFETKKRGVENIASIIPIKTM
jgi:hypothetical protein